MDTTTKDAVLDEVSLILTALSHGGHSARIVGGAVRDIAQGIVPDDIDIATTALPDDVVALFRKRNFRVFETGLQHGTVTVLIGDKTYEITTLREDVTTDGRRATVKYHTDWVADASRRDLTINAMSMSIDGTIHDYHGGIDDLKDHRVRFVGDPEKRIVEDYLRILRFFRFASRLPQKPYFANDQLAAITKHRAGLRRISVERVWAEMQKILVAPQAMWALSTMAVVGVLGALEIHRLDFSKFERVNSTNAITKLVALTGRDASVIATRWKMSSIEIELAEFLASHNDIYMEMHDWQRLIAIKGVRPAFVEELAKLKSFDLNIEPIAAAKRAVFPIDGNDMTEKGLKGKQVGVALAQLRELWFESQFTATKQQLLNFVDTTPELFV